MATSSTEDKFFATTLDLGHLSAFNRAVVNNETGTINEAFIQELGREQTQNLIKHIFDLPSEAFPDVRGRIATLPAGSYQLPREKPIPTEKAPTKWEEFAKLKGITQKKGRDRLIWDENKEEYLARYGHNKANDEAAAPILEVNINDGEAIFEDPWTRLAKEKKERVKKNKEQQLANIIRAAPKQSARVPGAIDLSSVVEPKKIKRAEKRKKPMNHTDIALSIAQRSTPSMGKFDKKFKHEPASKPLPLMVNKSEREAVRTDINSEKKQSMNVLDKLFRHEEESEKFDARKGVNQMQNAQEEDRWATSKKEAHKKSRKRK